MWMNTYLMETLIREHMATSSVGGAARAASPDMEPAHIRGVEGR